MGLVFGIIALVILIVMAAFLAMAETALMRVSRIRVRYLTEKKVKKADKLQKLIENPDYFYPTILLVALAVQLTSASLATWLTLRLTHNAGLGVAAGTVAITVLLFIFGELVPKSAASHDSERLALRVTRPVAAISWLLHPLSLVFEYIARGILKLLRREVTISDMIVSEEGEIKALVTAAEEQEIIEEEEKEMIHSVFEFSDTLVREVMVPRPDMVTLSTSDTVRDAILETIEHGFSRIPVYQKDLDNIRGVFYAKDLIKYLQKGSLDEPVGGLTREAFFVPETKLLSDLLHDFKKRKVHMAVVVDEYGTVAGLVTIEDLLEEIVGEIFDEFDREINLVEKLGDDRYRVDARITIDDLNEILPVELPKEEDIDTMGGLVLKILGHVPIAGESFEYNGVAIKVEKIRNNRISKVLLNIISSKPAGGA
jgi:putative hemolysin